MWIPYNSSTASDACQAVREVELSRPPASEQYIATQFILAVLLAVLFIGVIPVLGYFRKDPMFYRIRPFRLYATMCILSTLYGFGTLMPEAQVADFPCGSVLAIHTAGTIMATCFIQARIFLFVVETRYHQLLLQQNITSLDDGAGSMGGSTSAEKGKPGFLPALRNTLRLGMHMTPIEQLSIPALANMRRYYVSLVMINALSPFLVFLFGIGAFPIYRSLHCVNCFIFVEFVLLVTLPQVLPTLLIAGFVRVAVKLEEDDQGVVREFKWLLFTALPPLLLAYAVFHLFDPNGLAYDRKFNPQSLASFGGLAALWLITFWGPCFQAILFRRERAKVIRQRKKGSSVADVNSTSITALGKADFTTQFATNLQLKNEFYQFAANRFCMENLNFWDDYKKYKLEVGLQSEKWFQAKAQKMIKTYIENDSDQEINISETLRQGILSNSNVEALSMDQLATLFDSAGEEVMHLMYTGLWIDFQAKQAKSNKRLTVIAKVRDA